ncbi:conserved hypothetical protein [Histoplasma mississippiense (nom. inval.)]|uniref:conserved hypothetical protein n=1 Tax=Ajellomyces capsulatus (strain NAm1 / WU24) TaxID=2059318 RepID=UPI000157C279|nr:conserved hypothetical protein [Histoplasma mississippiense (nom. inval.)]EDN07632.1 conserved hypothetical protein [Histoplasma mississippiense (nom. inval.)]
MGPKRQSLKNLAGVQDLNRKNTSFCRRPTYALCVFTVLFMLFYRGHASPNPVSPEEEILQLNATQLRVFQVYKPVPDEPSHEIPGGCNAEILLMRHEFGSSYGHPFVGNYVPPRCDFDTVIMTMTVTSKGRQFDRLALMFLGDTEVFRTSTAEPTTNGIIWTYLKDMSLYKALWAKPQKLIFDLGNLINDKYTGPFDVKLTAKFSLKFHGIRAADIILPISARLSVADSPSGFNIPDDNATVTHIIHPDVSRATVSISACGQSTEEFWYSNVLSSDVLTFNKTAGPLSLSVTSPSSQWTQSLSFSNSGSFSEQGQTQLIKQVTDATSESLDLMGEKDLVISRIASSYPLEVCSTYQSNPNGLEINASLSRGLQFSYQSDVSYYSPYTLTTGSSEYDARQLGKATYRSMSKGSSSSTGDTLEIFKEKSAGATFDAEGQEKQILNASHLAVSTMHGWMDAHVRISNKVSKLSELTVLNLSFPNPLAKQKFRDAGCPILISARLH